MTKQECAIVELYTGKCMCVGNDRKYAYEYAEKLMGRPVYTHEFAVLADELRERSKPDFVKLCRESVDESEIYGDMLHRGWIPVTLFQPDDDTEVLVTYIVNGNKKKRYVMTAEYCGDRWMSLSDEYMLSGNTREIIAWMPLPDPYEG